MISEPIITDDQKEACAVGTMRAMLEDYSADSGISFEQALELFTSTRLYEALFDYDTKLWIEGPDYLAALFKQALDEGGVLGAGQP